MSEPERDLIERVIQELQRPAPVDSQLGERVMARVLLQPRRPRSRRIALITTLCAAAGVAALLLARPGPVPPPVDHRAVQFSLDAPGASTVTVVGDFNDWNTTTTPLSRARSGNSWKVTVLLPPGRYNYAFVVNGTKWVPDPIAPRTTADDFGAPNSVVTVGGAEL